MANGKLSIILEKTKQSLVPIFYLIFTCNIQMYNTDVLDEIRCYDDVITDGIIDIDSDTESTNTVPSIFFHDVTCNDDKDYIIKINEQQACAVESAAKLNPNHTVYLLYNSPIKYESPDRPNFIQNTSLVHKLLTYENIKIRRINFTKYTKETPMELWYQLGNLNLCWNPIDYTSALIRILTLWKYGGTYLDMDVLVLKSLSKLGNNYVGRQPDGSFDAAVLNFDLKGMGHTFAGEYLREIRNNMKYHFSYIGSVVLKECLNNVCNNTKINVKTKNCQGITLHGPSIFYPISEQYSNDIFDNSKIYQVLTAVKDSHVVKLWNHENKKMVKFIKKGTGAYGVIAEINCPKVYSTWIE